MSVYLERNTSPEEVKNDKAALKRTIEKLLINPDFPVADYYQRKRIVVRNCIDNLFRNVIIAAHMIVSLSRAN